MYPVVCFSCGNPIGHLWLNYFEEIQTKSNYEVLREMGISDECCRRMFICQIPNVHNLVY